ncbi:MAG TPA: hypothetical protein VEH75_07150 [Xanthobacteraceae bacterium]|nr:hypothetical protein [Xanthobacteraceae bacterium]
MGIGRKAFKVWLTASICWIIAIGVTVNAGGIFPAYYQTNFPLRADLEPWQREWSTSDPLRHPLYEIIRSPAAEKLPAQFQSRFYQGALWNQHIHARALASHRFPSGETLDLPAELTDADTNYLKQAFWDQRWRRWRETLGPFARAAIFVPLVALALLWIGRRIMYAGKEPEPEAPRLPYTPGMERLRNVTLAVSGVQILLWLLVGALNYREEPQPLADVASIMFVAMLPVLAAFVMSLFRRGPLTAAVLAGFGLTMLLPQLTVRIVPESWLAN